MKMVRAVRSRPVPGADRPKQPSNPNAYSLPNNIQGKAELIVLLMTC